MNAVAAWQRACDRLRSLGDRIGAPPFGNEEAALAEGVEHLVDQTVVWLGWETLHADPSRPAFHRHNDLVSQWGGPNADNVYRHCRIDPARRYVVRGRMHSCDDFLLAVRAGFMHRATWGTLAQLTASEHHIGPGDDFELHFGGDRPDAIELPPESIMLSVREYYFDWRADEPATFTIECLDPAPASAPTAAELVQRLDESVNEIEESITYWNDYLADNRAERVDNSFTTNTVKVGKGLSVARYEFCFWHLTPEQALIVEFEEPSARYWSIQLYMLHTFELVDPFGAITSRNHRQSSVSADGRVRVVLSGRDPGVPNWLDTGGRRNGLCTVRWFWPHDDTRPGFTSRLVPVDAVTDGWPVDEELVTPSQRATELADRQAHLRWRFRS